MTGSAVSLVSVDTVFNVRVVWLRRIIPLAQSKQRLAIHVEGEDIGPGIMPSNVTANLCRIDAFHRNIVQQDGLDASFGSGHYFPFRINDATVAREGPPGFM